MKRYYFLKKVFISWKTRKKHINFTIDIYNKIFIKCVGNNSNKTKNKYRIMKKNGYSNIPVYDENENFIGILNDARLLYWISDLLINNDYIDLGLTKVEHIQLQYNWKDYRFISQDTTIFEAWELFTQSRRTWGTLNVLFITATGNPNEEILWLISNGDANIIDDYLIV